MVNNEKLSGKDLERIKKVGVARQKELASQGVTSKEAKEQTIKELQARPGFERAKEAFENTESQVTGQPLTITSVQGDNVEEVDVQSEADPLFIKGKVPKGEFQTSKEIKPQEDVEKQKDMEIQKKRQNEINKKQAEEDKKIAEQQLDKFFSDPGQRTKEEVDDLRFKGEIETPDAQFTNEEERIRFIRGEFNKTLGSEKVDEILFNRGLIGEKRTTDIVEDEKAPTEPKKIEETPSEEKVDEKSPTDKKIEAQTIEGNDISNLNNFLNTGKAAGLSDEENLLAARQAFPKVFNQPLSEGQVFNALKTNTDLSNVTVPVATLASAENRLADFNLYSTSDSEQLYRSMASGKLIEGSTAFTDVQNSENAVNLQTALEKFNKEKVSNSVNEKNKKSFDIIKGKGKAIEKPTTTMNSILEKISKGITEGFDEVSISDTEELLNTPEIKARTDMIESKTKQLAEKQRQLRKSEQDIRDRNKGKITSGALARRLAFLNKDLKTDINDLEEDIRIEEKLLLSESSNRANVVKLNQQARQNNINSVSSMVDVLGKIKNFQKADTPDLKFITNQKTGQSIAIDPKTGEIKKTFFEADAAADKVTDLDQEALTFGIGKEVFGTRISDREGKKVEEFVDLGMGEGLTEEQIIDKLIRFDVKENVELGQYFKDVVRSLDLEDGLSSFDMRNLSFLLNNDKVINAIKKVERGVYEESNSKGREASAIFSQRKGNDLKKLISDNLDKLGITRGNLEEQKSKLLASPEFTAIKGGITGLVSKWRLEHAGSNVTEGENKFLDTIIANVTDNPFNAITKIDEFQKLNLEILNSTREEFLLPRLTGNSLINNDDRISLYENHVGNIDQIKEDERVGVSTPKENKEDGLDIATSFDFKEGDDLKFGGQTLKITSFGGKRDDFTGLDLDGKLGEKAPAFLRGKVTKIDSSPIFGNFVVVEDDNGNKVQISHLDKTSVNVGDEVGKTDQVGTIGNTGNVLKLNGKKPTKSELSRGVGSHIDLVMTRDGKKLKSMETADILFGSLKESQKVTDKYKNMNLDENAGLSMVDYIKAGGIAGLTSAGGLLAQTPRVVGNMAGFVTSLFSEGIANDIKAGGQALTKELEDELELTDTQRTILGGGADLVTMVGTPFGKGQLLGLIGKLGPNLAKFAPKVAQAIKDSPRLFNIVRQSIAGSELGAKASILAEGEIKAKDVVTGAATGGLLGGLFPKVKLPKGVTDKFTLAETDRAFKILRPTKNDVITGIAEKGAKGLADIAKLSKSKDFIGLVKDTKDLKNLVFKPLKAGLEAITTTAKSKPVINGLKELDILLKGVKSSTLLKDQKRIGELLNKSKKGLTLLEELDVKTLLTKHAKLFSEKGLERGTSLGGADLRGLLSDIRKGIETRAKAGGFADVGPINRRYGDLVNAEILLKEQQGLATSQLAKELDPNVIQQLLEAPVIRTATTLGKGASREILKSIGASLRGGQINSAEAEKQLPVLLKKLKDANVDKASMDVVQNIFNKIIAGTQVLSNNTK